ncbi:MAG: 4Fe-4S ferredoxin, partial [Dehalococcoidales bacterium]
QQRTSTPTTEGKGRLMGLLKSIRQDIQAARERDPAATSTLEVIFAYPGFHQDFLSGHSLLIACPKLDDYPAHLAKLTEILRVSDIKSLTVVHMEVPCCFGIVQMARQAVEASGRDIPLKEVNISIRGEIKTG